MSLCKTIAWGSVGGIMIGALGAAAGASAGAIGTAILKDSGYEGYEPTEAAQMGAIGGAVLQGSVGVLVGALSSCGIFSKTNTTQTAISYVAGTVITGLVGYGIMNADDHETIMQLGQTAASFAVGGAVTLIPASCALICIALPMVAAIHMAKEEDNVPNYSVVTPYNTI